jgi:hypothetical protein
MKQRHHRSLPAAERFVLYERFALADDRTVTCWPDASCLFAIPLPSAGTHPFIVEWEYARSTESIGQAASKMVGYKQLLASGAYAKHWPGVIQPTVRIFFVMQSVARLQNLAEAIAQYPGVCDAVRLATVADLTPQRLLTEPIWRTVQGDCLPILRTPAPAAAS